MHISTALTKLLALGAIATSAFALPTQHNDTTVGSDVTSNLTCESAPSPLASSTVPETMSASLQAADTMYSHPPDHGLDSIASNAQPLHSTDGTTPLPTPSQPAPADEDDNTPLLSLLQPRQPFTPHRYALICRSTSSLGLKYDDIPLSRRCTANPYKYRCDWDGSPDIGDGGRTDAECDRKCECRDVSADPKPLCVALGKGGWGVCGV